MALAAVFALAAEPAHAHPPPLGIPGFFGGLLHPLLATGHLMAMLGLGLLVGQDEPRRDRIALAVFVAALIAGLAALTTGVAPQWPAVAVLLTALVCGALTALAHPLPRSLVWALSAITGLVIGLDSPPEVLSLREANLMLIGTALGGAVLMLATVAIASQFIQPWQRIGARVIGSWIAASAILVLALTQLR